MSLIFLFLPNSSGILLIKVLINDSLLIASFVNQCSIVSHSGLNRPFFFCLIPLFNQLQTLFNSRISTGVVLTLEIKADKGSISIPITLCPAKIPSTNVVPEPQKGSNISFSFCPTRYLSIAHLGT